jgi:hypothetical protein
VSYASAEYTRSLADFGAPRRLDHSGGWVLERPLPGPVARKDACGPYPLFSCAHWSGLDRDLDTLRQDGLVSLVLVADPLSAPPAAALPTLFPNLCRPWKDHYLVDLAPGTEFGTAHHRRNARRFGRHASVEEVADPRQLLDEWCALYDKLCERHAVTGMARFSRRAFARQLALPGALVLRAVTSAGCTAGLQIWLTEDDRAWHHLSAYGREGYRWGGASYALVRAALGLLRDRGVAVADLGSGAGLTADPTDGLSRFKQGWATHTAPAWLCGVILDERAHDRAAGDHATDFFPAYRDPALVDTPEVTPCR